MPANQATTSYDSPETHAVLVARDRIHLVADAYEAIGEQLAQARRQGSARSQPTSRPPVDLHLTTVRMEIDSWATWLGHAVLDAHDAAGQPVELSAWTPALLREIASDHLGVFFSDPLQAAEFMEGADEHAHRARAAAWPTGARWIRLHVPCPEVVGDDAHRAPCGGEFRMWMRPGQDTLGDLVCDRDRGHRITPAEWQRAMRRRPVDEAAAARLVRTIRLAGRSVTA